MGFSGQEDWSGLPRPPPGGLSDPGIKPGLSPALADGFFPTEPPRKPLSAEREDFLSDPGIVGSGGGVSVLGPAQLWFLLDARCTVRSL